jgi:hypothetical protein
LYVLFVCLALRELTFLLESTSPGRERCALILTVVPYLTGGLLSCIAGLFNPVGMVLVAISAAAASLGGTSGLAWMAMLLRGPWFPRVEPPAPFTIARSWTWIVAATILAVLFIAVLGPGLGFQ